VYSGGALTGVWLVKLDNNIFVQISLVVLIGLAAKTPFSLSSSRNSFAEKESRG
jgi:hypothetical protein